MKSAWDAATSDFVRRERRVITRRDFPVLLSQVWKNGYTKENGINGFKHAGIIPYNHEVVAESSVHYSELFAEPDLPTEESVNSAAAGENTVEATEEFNGYEMMEYEDDNISTVQQLHEQESEVNFPSADPSTCTPPSTCQQFSPFPVAHRTPPVVSPQLSVQQHIPIPVAHQTPPAVPSPQSSAQQTIPVPVAHQTPPAVDSPQSSAQQPIPVPLTHDHQTPTVFSPQSSVQQQSSVPVAYQTPVNISRQSTIQQSDSTPTTNSSSCSNQELRAFFADLLVSHTPTRPHGSRHRLTGIGESLTSEEAIEMVRKAEEEKRKKEEEKKEKKRIREEKKRQRETQSKKSTKRKKTSKQAQKNTTTTQPVPCTEPETTSRAHPSPTFLDPCAHCGLLMTTEDATVECHVCILSYHVSCVSYDTDIDEVNYVCSECQ